MKHQIRQAVVCAALLAGGWSAPASTLDQIGVTLLRAVTTNVDGSGIRVAQPEADYPLGSTNWEINPAVVGQPAGRFTYYSSFGNATNFPNSVGSDSGHADGVGDGFYSPAYGVATNVAHIDSYDADYFIQNYLFDENTLMPVLAPLPSTAAVVNQSFTWGAQPVNVQRQIDFNFDKYATAYGTLFVSAVANGGQVCAPGTAYNSIGVAAYGGSSSIGPTIDNGRCKPDLAAPGTQTSEATPLVSGAATVLLQAALRGDGGNTNDASDMRVIKALLLNGAVKPADWTNANSSPLDARYGAGVLNVFNSYEQLGGCQHGWNCSTNVASGAAHLPVAVTNTVPVLSGWDFNTNSSGTNSASVSHYFFNITNIFSGAQFTATATLVWNRQFGQTNINDLDLFLYNCANSNLVACSTSRVDNVEHIFITKLAQGRYDLQILKNGGTNTVTTNETYALAFDFVPPFFGKAGANITLTWPSAFGVETATHLTTPNWIPLTNPPPAVIYGQSQLILSPTNTSQFFRLSRP